MKHHRAIRMSESIFLGCMAILYVVFMLCDFFDGSSKLSSVLKFSSIVGCFLFSMRNDGTKLSRIVTIGLLFTVLADVFLLFTDHYFYGVLSFCIVQLLYFWRIRIWNPTITINHLMIRVLITIGCLCTLSMLKLDLDRVLGITVFYFVNFVGNLILLVLTFKRISHQLSFRLFFLGMGLFFLCDLCVGIFNLSDYISVHGSIMQPLFSFVSLGMWGFYLPGQVLIALSCRDLAND